MPAASRLTIRERAEFRLARALARLPHRAQVWLSGKPPVEIDGQRLHPEIQLTLALIEKRGDPPSSRCRPPRPACAPPARPSRWPRASPGSARCATSRSPAPPARCPPRHYAPEEPGGPHGLLVFLHGGGFVIGDLDSHDGVCRMLCRHAGRPRARRRLPPGARSTASRPRSTTRWRRCAGRPSTPPSSAPTRRGSRSAATARAATSPPVACQLAAREGGPLPAAQLLIYPVTDSAARHAVARRCSPRAST